MRIITRCTISIVIRLGMVLYGMATLTVCIRSFTNRIILSTYPTWRSASHMVSFTLYGSSLISDSIASKALSAPILTTSMIPLERYFLWFLFLIHTHYTKPICLKTPTKNIIPLTCSTSIYKLTFE